MRLFVAAMLTIPHLPHLAANLPKCVAFFDRTAAELAQYVLGWSAPGNGRVC